MKAQKKLVLLEHIIGETKQYQVMRIEDSVQYSIGDLLPATAVQRIIDSRQWLVRVTGILKPISPLTPMQEAVLERSVPIFYLSDNDFGIQGLPVPSEELFNNVLHELREMYDQRWESDFQAAYGLAKEGF